MTWVINKPLFLKVNEIWGSLVPEHDHVKSNQDISPPQITIHLISSRKTYNIEKLSVIFTQKWVKWDIFIYFLSYESFWKTKIIIISRKNAKPNNYMATTPNCISLHKQVLFLWSLAELWKLTDHLTDKKVLTRFTGQEKWEQPHWLWWNISRRIELEQKSQNGVINDCLWPT